MSRNIAAKIKISGKLVADAPISVGGTGAGDMVDIDLAVDGMGRYYIPGSSITGPIRSWVEMNLEAPDGGKPLDGHEIAKKLFGCVENGEDDHASFLAMNDGVILPIEPVEAEGDTTGRKLFPTRERRHGISIDESSGTAREHFFYTRALLPKGTAFKLSMELDVARCDIDMAAGTLIKIVAALTDGKIRFGSCKTRGFGTMKLEDPVVDFYDFSCAAELDKWLYGEQSSSRGLDSLNTGHEVVKLRPNQRYEIKINWAPISRIMVKSGRDGIETDMLPLVSKLPGGISPVIPGTSIKGVLRSQACRIMRTIFGQDPSGNERYLDIVNDMFGDKNTSGRVFVEDVYLSSPTGISNKDWIEENKNELDNFTVHEDHVVIDRFTGGASEGALYSARPVPRRVVSMADRSEREICWNPIKITIDFSSKLNAQRNREQLAKLALMELIIRDMRDGLVPIGFGTNRGFGDIEIRDVARSDDYMRDEIKIKEAWGQFIQNDGKLSF
jgi:CRISPR/Cas system CSM-associated protein Csm3 (group 7 of RAMP superfamily)